MSSNNLFLRDLREPELANPPIQQLSLVDYIAPATEVKSFTSAVTGERILWNTAELNPYIIRVPAIEEIEAIVAEEEKRAVQFRWTEQVCSIDRGQVRGLREGRIDKPWLVKLLDPTSNPKRFCLSNKDQAVLDTFTNKPVEEQQRFLLDQMPSTLAEFDEHGTVDNYNANRSLFMLLPSQAKIADSIEWLCRFHSLLLSPPKACTRGHLFALAANLREKGILLLSQCAAACWRRYTCRAGDWSGAASVNVYGRKKAVDSYARYTKGVLDNDDERILSLVKSVHPAPLHLVVEKRLDARISDILWCSTLRDLNKQVTWEFVEGFLMPAGNRPTHSIALTNTLKAAARLNSIHSPTVETPNTFMPSLRAAVVGREAEMTEWLNLLEEYYLTLTQKTTHHIAAGLRHYLLWLLTLPNVPKPSELTRTLLRQDGNPQANTLRAYLQKSEENSKYRNSIFGVIHQFFIWAAVHRSDFKNPIAWNIDKYKMTVGTRPDSKTHRKRLPGIVLDDIRNFLITRTEAGFQWSPWVLENSKLQLGGEMVFCPIYPAIIAMLLKWPLRSNQVLWLDSGELDEETYDFAQRKFSRNPSGLSKRNYGVLTPAIDSGALNGNHHVDLQVILNKRPVGEKSDYTIPYVDDETIWIVEQVLLFHRQFNFQPKLVVESDAPSSTNINKSKEVRELLPEVCCLFRHPDCRSHYPPDNWAVNKFWSEACAAYDESNANWLNPITQQRGQRPNWPKMARFAVKDYSVPNYRRDGTSRPVRITSQRYRAIFDIHSLRVAGISYLLDRGISLAVVASIAGHNSLVMTLHYYVLERETIRKKLSEVLRDKPEMLQTAKIVEERLKSMDNPKGWLNAMTDDAFDALHLAIKEGGNYRITEKGICPGTRCEDGLRLNSREGKNTNGIVPGSLCGLCKYNLYGPVFLPGLIREFNETLYALERIAKKQISLRTAEREMEAIGEFDKATTIRNEDELLVRSAEPSCAHLVRLYEMIQEVSQMKSNGKTLALVAQETVKCTVDVATNFEQMQEILELSELLPASHSLVPDQVSISFQNKLLGVLVKNGVTPYLAGLPESVAKKASLDLAALLAKSIPARNDLEDVFQGRKLLKDIGMSNPETLASNIQQLASNLQPKALTYEQ